MNRQFLVLMAALALAAPAGAQGERVEVNPEAFVVMEHQGGSLAVNLTSIASVFRAAGKADSPGPVRLNLRSGGHQSLEGKAAGALWSSLAEGSHSEAFVWVSHMGGTLGIPVAAIESAFRTGSDSAPAVRINYIGDPAGKTVQGDEADAV